MRKSKCCGVGAVLLISIAVSAAMSAASVAAYALCSKWCAHRETIPQQAIVLPDEP